MWKVKLQSKLNRWWYSKANLMAYLLWPLSCVYRFVLLVRKSFFKLGVLPAYRATVPVIVVGHITLGGVGKTPMVSAIARHFIQQGKRVGIVSRGYGGKATHWPQRVTADSDPVLVGDEPVMLAQQLGCCVVVARQRVEAIRVCEKTGCDVIISDDGLSHYYFERDVECILIDGSRGLGNGFCIPAGPLRESAVRLQSASLVLINSQDLCDKNHFYLQALALVALSNKEAIAINSFKDKAVHAVSAIGNNDRFFYTLRGLGYKVTSHPYPDHYHLSDKEFSFADKLPIIITEKDAVKCRQLAGKYEIYVLQVHAVVHPAVYQKLDGLIKY